MVLRRIGDYAWEGCKGLRELNLPESIRSIGSFVVKFCPNLKEFVIPDSCETIKGIVVIGSTKLDRIHIGKSLKSIEWIYYTDCVREITCDPDNQYFMTQEGILYDKSGETILSIPPSVSQDVVIREGCVHMNKDMLNSWQYPKDTVSQNTHIDAFFPHFRTLSIPSTLVDITLDYAFHCMTELESISVHPDNPNFTSRDGLLYTKSMDTLVGYPTGKRRYNPGIEVIPEGVKTIAPTVLADTY